MYESNHGGGCCGITHMMSFPTTINHTSSESFLRQVERFPKGRSLEVVLTDDQAKAWGPTLSAGGFIPVFRFVNSNSDNALTVFYRHGNPLPLEDLPFSLNPDDRPKAPPPPKPIESRPLVEGETLKKGDRVVIYSTLSRFHRQQATVVSTRTDGRVNVRVSRGVVGDWVEYTALKPSSIRVIV